MKPCSKCNKKFGILDKLKSVNKNQVEIQCSKCKTTYKQREIQSKGIRYFSICMAMFFITCNSCFFEKCIDNAVTRAIAIVGIFIFIIYAVILGTQNWLEYERDDNIE